MRNLHRGFILCFIILFVSGCSNPKDTISPSPTTVIPTPKKPVATSTPLPTQTVEIPTQIITPAILTPTTSKQPVKQCITIMNNLPDQSQLRGNIIVHPRRFTDDINYGSYIWNLKTNKSILFTGNIDTIIVSPDGSKVAYDVWNKDGSKGDLFIRSAKGEIIKTFVLKDDLGPLEGWQDEDHVILRYWTGHMDISKGIKYYFYQYNLNDGSKQLIKTPVISDLDTFSINNWALNGDFSYMITVWSGEHPGNPHRWGYEIWNLGSQQSSFVDGEELRTPFYADFVWYDQSDVIVSMDINKTDSDLFMMDIAGKKTQLTFLGDLNYDIARWQLSPDKRKLGMVVYTGTKDETISNLFILDMKTGVVTDTCLQVDPSRGSYIFLDPTDYSFSPIWSPDSRYLLIETFIKDNTSRLLRVDLDQQIAVPISNNLEPLGWLVDP